MPTIKQFVRGHTFDNVPSPSPKRDRRWVWQNDLSCTPSKPLIHQIDFTILFGSGHLLGPKITIGHYHTPKHPPNCNSLTSQQQYQSKQSRMQMIVRRFCIIQESIHQNSMHQHQWPMPTKNKQPKLGWEIGKNDDCKRKVQNGCIPKGASASRHREKR